MPFLKRLLLFACVFWPLYAQTGNPVLVQADCYANFAFNSTGNAAVIDNHTSQCDTWTASYNATTGISALSLTVQGAVNAGGTPPIAGAYGTFQSETGATLVSGSNPATALQGTATFTGALPFVRVNLGSLTGTGTIYGVLYGFKIGSGGGGGGGGGGGTCPSATPCIVIGPTATGSAPTTAPVYVSGRDGSGNVYPEITGTLHATISASSSGNTQIIALSSGKTIYVTHWDVTPTNSGTSVGVKLTTGTGSNCATGTANLTGVISNILAVSMDYANGPLIAAVSNAVCLNLDAAIAVAGTVTYAIF